MNETKTFKNFAFISYSHKDMKQAERLDNFLLDFRLPVSVKQKYPDRRDSFKDIETVIPIIDSIMVKIVNTLFFNSNKRDLLIDSYIYNNRQLTPESSDNKEQYYRKLLKIGRAHV